MRLTSQHLELMPDNGKRYEIMDDDLHVTPQPHWYHQRVCTRLGSLLDVWSHQTKVGQVNIGPRVIFAEEDADVAPDVVWISYERLATALQSDGKLHAAPELTIEVTSPGTVSEQRDRNLKCKIYSIIGVMEYWVVSWQERRLEIYRREGPLLKIAMTLYENDLLQSPLLPGFACQVKDLFDGVP